MAPGSAETAREGAAAETGVGSGSSASCHRAESVGASDCAAPTASVRTMTGVRSRASARRSSRGKALAMGAGRTDGSGAGTRAGFVIRGRAGRPLASCEGVRAWRAEAAVFFLAFEGFFTPRAPVLQKALHRAPGILSWPVSQGLKQTFRGCPKCGLFRPQGKPSCLRMSSAGTPALRRNASAVSRALFESLRPSPSATRR